jgi:hypothetical protein
VAGSIGIDVVADKTVGRTQEHRPVLAVAPARAEIDRHAHEGDFDMACDEVFLAHGDRGVGKGRNAARLEHVMIKADRAGIAVERVEHRRFQGRARVETGGVGIERDGPLVDAGVECGIGHDLHQARDIGVDFRLRAGAEIVGDLFGRQVEHRQPRLVPQECLLVRAERGDPGRDVGGIGRGLRAAGRASASASEPSTTRSAAWAGERKGSVRISCTVSREEPCSWMKAGSANAAGSALSGAWRHRQGRH